jgi:UDP-N-acetylmuramate: L-alanyl-gamma-D-glutamyl-meso-diaminopimelate ligase
MYLHILGIGGTFMGSLAKLALQSGHTVTGCDTKIYPPMSDQLKDMGIRLFEGYDSDQIQLRPDVLVIGNIVGRPKVPGQPGKFPLMEAILNTGAHYTSGPQWLADYILRGRQVIAITGTHGKTTTSAMLAWVTDHSGLKPGFLIGGIPLNFQTSAQLGHGKVFIIEADEYDTAFFDKRSKFLHYHPHIAILNNLEFDHADIFEDLASIERQFEYFLRTIPQQGLVVYNREDTALHRVLSKGCWSQQTSFGLQGADYYSQGKPDHFEVYHQDAKVGEVRWSLNGLHNQYNALACIATAQHLGIHPKESSATLGRFLHVKRRLEIRGTQNGITVYDDFAHHPSAIRLTLLGLREQLGPEAHIVAVFEPRSNTMRQGTMRMQLPNALKTADFCICYAKDLNWNAKDTFAEMGKRTVISHTIPETLVLLQGYTRPGSHVVFMSNGDFDNIHQRFLHTLSHH